jgi:hypothetical protein
LRWFGSCEKRRNSISDPVVGVSKRLELRSKPEEEEDEVDEDEDEEIIVER